MEALVQFIKKTKELKRILEGDFPTEERDECVEKVNTLLDDRQQLFSTLPDLSSLKGDTKEELLKLEREILSLMDKQKKHIMNDLKTLQLKKQKDKHYSNPYANISADGMFLDKKK